MQTGPWAQVTSKDLRADSHRRSTPVADPTASCGLHAASRSLSGCATATRRSGDHVCRHRRKLPVHLVVCNERGVPPEHGLHLVTGLRHDRPRVAPPGQISCLPCLFASGADHSSRAPIVAVARSADFNRILDYLVHAFAKCLPRREVRLSITLHHRSDVDVLFRAASKVIAFR